MEIPTWEDIVNSPGYAALSADEKKMLREKWQKDFAEQQEKNAIDALPTVEQWKDETGLPTWREIVSSQKYKSLTPEQKRMLRAKYEKDIGGSVLTQVFKSDASWLGEFVQGIKENSIIGEFFEPSADTIPTTSAGKFMRGFGSLTADLPFYTAGAAIGAPIALASGLTPSNVVSTAAVEGAFAFGLPTLLQNVLRAKNQGRIAQIPIKSDADVPGDLVYPEEALAYLRPRLDKDNPDYEEFMNIVKETAKQTGVSALTGAVLGATSKALTTPAKNMAIYESIEKKIAANPKEAGKVLGLVENTGKINLNARYLQSQINKVASLIEKGEYSSAADAINIMRKLSTIAKPVESVVIPTAVLTGVPAAVEQRLPTAEELGHTAGIVAAMPLLGEATRKAFGAKGTNITGIYREKIERKAAELQKEMPLDKQVENASKNSFDNPLTVYKYVKQTHPEIASTVFEQVSKDMGANERYVAHKTIVEMIQKEETRLINEFKEKTGVRRISRKNIVDSETYEKLSPQMKVFAVPASEKLIALRAKAEAIKMDASDVSAIEYKAGELLRDMVFSDTMTLIKTKSHSLRDAIEKLNAHTMAIEEYLQTGKTTKTLEYFTNALVKNRDLVKGSVRQGIIKNKETGKYEISKTLMARITEAFATVKSIPRRVSEVDAKTYIEFSGRNPNVINKDGKLTLKDKHEYWIATPGGKIVVPYQLLFTDVKVARKMYPDSRIIKIRNIPADNVYLTEQSKVLYYKPPLTGKTTGAEKFQFISLKQEQARAMVSFLHNLEERGVDVSIIKKIMGYSEKTKEHNAVIQLDTGRIHHETKEPISVHLTSNEILDTNEEIRSPITGAAFEFVYNMVRTQTRKQMAAMQSKLTQGAYFYDYSEQGKEFLRALRKLEVETMKAANRDILAGMKYFKKLSKESREAITYAITMQNPIYAKYYEAIGYRCKRDPRYIAVGENALSILSGRERIAAEWLIKYYDSIGKIINESRKALGRDEIALVENNSYSPLSGKDTGVVMMLVNMMRGGENVIGKDKTEIARAIEAHFDVPKIKAGQVPFHNIKTRMFGVDKPEMDCAKLFYNYAQQANKYINVQPFTTYIDDILHVREVNGVKFSFEDIAPNSVFTINRIISDLGFLQIGHRFAEGKTAGADKDYDLLRSIAMRLQHNTVASILVGNAQVAINQLAALRNSVYYLGPRGIIDMAAEIVGFVNPKRIVEAVRESDVLYARWDSPIPELFNNLSRLERTIDDAGMLPTKIVDIIISSAFYRAAKRKYIREYGDADKKAVIDYANDLTAKSQASTLLADRAPIQRGISGMIITSFANAAINDWNIMLHDVSGVGRSISPGRRFAQVLYFAMATAAMNTFYEDFLNMESVYPAPIERYKDLKRRGKKDREAIFQMLAEMLKIYPLFQGSRVGGSVLGPLVTQVDTIMRASSDVRFVDKALVSLAMVAGVRGTTQIRRIIRAAEKDLPFDEYIRTAKSM